MHIDNSRISLYIKANDNIGTFEATKHVFNIISGNADYKVGKGTLADHTARTRAEKDKTKRNKIKTQGPGVTWSGYFIKRNKESIHTHSGLICMDLDGLNEKLAETFKLICEDPLTLSAFVSPSGNGLKIIYAIDMADVDEKNVTPEHELYFAAIRNYLIRKYNVKDEFDDSGKDICRLCFLPYCPEIFVNNTPDIFGKSRREEELRTISDPPKQKPTAPAAPKKKTPAVQQEPEADEYDFEGLIEFTNNKETYQEGSYNAYLNQFAMNCNGRGIPQEETESFCLGRFTDYEPRLMMPVIRNVYKNKVVDFGKYKKKQRTPGQRSNNPLQNQDRVSEYVPDKNSGYNETILFWYVIEKENEKTGEKTEEVKFDHDKITYFLNNNGFKRMEVGEGYQFVQILENKLKPVKPEEITAFVYKYLSRNLKPNADGMYTNVEDELYQVRKMFKRGAKTYCNEKTFIALPLFKPKFVRDDENTAYFYFKNCYVEVTKAGIVTKDYKELKGQIWQKQIIDKEFSLLTTKATHDCVFQKFISLAIVGAKEDFTAVDKKKFLAAITGIGYLLHRFKDSTNAKAVVTVDKKLRHSNDSNGGSGKSLFFKAISQMLHTCIINGKAFKFDSQYPFGTLQVDHGLAVFNDVKKTFDFEELFHYITEDWDIKRLYENPIVIPFDDSAKIGVATNFSLKGNGDSFFRRQHIIEFDNHFNANHDPIKEFGHRFFRDWDKAEHTGEWNKFYNFMLSCVMEFLKTSLVAFPLENYATNKLIDAMGEDGYEWLCDNISDAPDSLFGIDIQINKDDLYKKFRSDLPTYEKWLKPNTFTGWVKEWAKINNLLINAHKNGGRDKSGPKDFWTFSYPKPAETK